MANNPFDLVNSYASMQAEMRPKGVGLGPNGPSSRPQFRPFTEQYGSQIQSNIQQRLARLAPNPNNKTYVPGGGSAQGLVAFRGRQVDGSVLGYAEEISRMFPGLRFSSGYRDPVANARANGVKNSYHLKGRALDFSGSARDMQGARQWALQNGAREALIHNAGSGVHLHVAW